MTKLVIVTRSGPRFQESRSLADQLQASVTYNEESARQWLSVREAEIENQWGAKFVRSCDVSSDYVLREVHCELSLAVSRG